MRGSSKGTELYFKPSAIVEAMMDSVPDPVLPSLSVTLTVMW